MQNTRLNTLIVTIGRQVSQELRNPWRRISLLIIALLFGIYLALSIAAIAGQLAYLDVVAAVIVILAVEAINWLFYGNRWNARRSLWGETLNALKLGLSYGLIIMAFLLAS
jgi:hypothetical protein